MTYPEALQFLDSFINYERTNRYRYPEDLSLDRISQLLERLGNPHLKYPTLHVAGTKGKGSTCAFAASILQAQGISVGLYTSPHLFSFRERMKVNGAWVSEGALAKIVAEVKPKALAVTGLTYFELVTACAFFYFAQASVEAAVIEVGLGGKWDATNVLTPTATAVTPVSLDHLPKLGNDLESIAREKAGIIKPGVPVVAAPQSPEAREVIAQRAVSLNAPLHWVEEEAKISLAVVGIGGSRFTLETPVASYPHLRIPLLGRHQIVNAAVALRVAELFSATGGVPWDLSAVRQGLEKTQWPGRCQFVKGAEGQADFLLDGAQNAASAQVLRLTVEELFPDKKITLIFGASIEKDLEGMAQVLGPLSGKLILTQAQNPRAEELQRLMDAFCLWHPDPWVVRLVPDAIERAQLEGGAGDLIVVTGSLFVVAEALEALKLTRACAVS